jgi:hypothetical protein
MLVDSHESIAMIYETEISIMTLPQSQRERIFKNTVAELFVFRKNRNII